MLAAGRRRWRVWNGVGAEVHDVFRGWRVGGLVGTAGGGFGGNVVTAALESGWAADRGCDGLVRLGADVGGE